MEIQITSGFQDLILSCEFELGQKFYTICKKPTTIYKPCGLCNNTREVLIDYEGTKYKVPCPRCASKHSKGEEDVFLQIDKYYKRELFLSKITLDQYGQVRFFLQDVGCSFIHNKEGTLSYIRSLIQSGDLYSDLNSCRKRLTELNKAEKHKEMQFRERIERGEI